MTSRSSTNQSSREAMRVREREKETYIQPRLLSRFLQTFLRGEIIIDARPSDSLSINDLPTRSLSNSQARKIYNAQKAPLIIYACDCIASFTRADNFFCALAIVRSLYAGGVAKRLPGVTKNFNLCVLLGVLLSVVFMISWETTFC